MNFLKEPELEWEDWKHFRDHVMADQRRVDNETDMIRARKIFDEIANKEYRNIMEKTKTSENDGRMLALFDITMVMIIFRSFHSIAPI